MGRVRFTGRDWVDPGACLTWQNHSDLLGILQTFYGNWFNIHTMKSMNTLTTIHSCLQTQRPLRSWCKKRSRVKLADTCTDGDTDVEGF